MVKNPTILIAEDIDQDIEMLLREFKSVGVQNRVQVVKDGQQAIQYFEGEVLFADRSRFPIPGVVLLDIQMPKKNGLAVLQYLKESPFYPDLLVVG